MQHKKCTFSYKVNKDEHLLNGKGPMAKETELINDSKKKKGAIGA